MDGRKAPSAFRRLAASQVEDGYEVMMIATNLRGVDHLTDEKALPTAGRHTNDVDNAGAARRK